MTEHKWEFPNYWIGTRHGMPRLVNIGGVFSVPCIVIALLFILADLVVLFSVRAWLIISLALTLAFIAWFILASKGARNAIQPHCTPESEDVLKRFALFFLFPLTSASASYATSRLQWLTIATALILAFKGAWLFIIWCVVRFWVLGMMGGFLNPTFQATSMEQSHALLEILYQVQSGDNPS